MKLLCTLEGVKVFQQSDNIISFIANADIDADGGVHAYNSRNTGLDDNKNAKNGSIWVGVATNSRGVPYKDSNGYYISTTAYQWPQYPINDHKRYVDSETVPYVVVSPLIRSNATGIILGCKAIITNTLTKQSIEAVVADIGPKNKLGEISIAAAKAIGINSNPRTGGQDIKVISYVLYPGIPAVVNGVTYNLIHC